VADVIFSGHYDVAGQTQEKSMFHNAGAFIQPCSQIIWIRHFAKICIQDAIVLIGLKGLLFIIKAQGDGGSL
jgi:hypothetical protein